MTAPLLATLVLSCSLAQLATGSSTPAALTPAAQLAFSPERGPGGAEHFVGRGAGYVVELTPSCLRLHLAAGGRRERIELELLGAAAARLRGEGRMRSRVHVLRGDDSAAWCTDMPRFERVRYPSVYPGIDLLARGTGRQLEYDFELAPHADPDSIRMRWRGTRPLALTEDGELLLATASGTIVQPAPVSWQDTPDGRRLPVQVRFVLEGEDTLRFAVASYDPALPLTIDPVVKYASYFGGSDVDVPHDVAVDAQGNAYVTGRTASIDLRTVRATQSALHGVYDAFVAKYSPAGQLLWSTYLGGNGDYRDFETGIAIAVDASGQVVLFGRTAAGDFPTTAGALQTRHGGGTDAFVCKLKADGSGFVWSTFLGGSGDENADTPQSSTIAPGALLLDRSGRILLAGTTDSADFPLRLALQARLGGMRDGFVTALDAQGQLLSSTYLGGTSIDVAHTLAEDASGRVLLAGATASPDFPVTAGAFDRRSLGGFVTQLDRTLGSILWSARFPAAIVAIDLDAKGDVYACGSTTSGCIPTTFGVLQPKHGGGSGTDGFVARFAADGSRIHWASYYGLISSDETAVDLRVDAEGHALVAVHGHRSFTQVSGARILEFDPEGSALAYEFLLSRHAHPTALARGGDGHVWVTGIVSHGQLPVTSGAAQSQWAGRTDGFVFRVDEQASGLGSLVVRTPKLARGASTTAVVSLDGKAAAATDIALSATPQGVVGIPAKVRVPAGGTSYRFRIDCPPLTAPQPVTITARLGSQSLQAKFEVWIGPSYHIRYLGNLGGSDSKVIATAINGLGQSTGSARANLSTMHAFVAESAPPLLDLGSGEGVDISERGDVLISAYRPTIWRAGQGSSFVNIPASLTQPKVTAFNFFGEVVGHAVNSSYRTRGFFTSLRWGVLELPTLGGPTSLAYGVNDTGTVVGESYDAQNQRRAYRWTRATSMQDLGTLPGHVHATAYAVNARDEIVGISAAKSFNAAEAFLWRPGRGMKGLGVLPGDAHSLAWGISERSEVVGFSAQSGAIDKRPFVWTEQTGMRDLRTLLDPEDAFGWTLTEAKDVNALGQIVGNGSLARDVCAQSGFRLDPVAFAPFGRGCGAAGARTPLLAGSGDAVPGGRIEFSLFQAAAQAPVVLLMGSARAALPLPGGCSLLLGGTIVESGVPLMTDVHGRLTLPLTLPTWLGPLQLPMQAFVIDTGAPNGLFTASNGLELNVR